MSAKKLRVGKVLSVPQDDRQKVLPFEQSDLSNLSTIDKASFLEGLQLNDGNPLHSTAMEEDLNVLEGAHVNKGKAGKKDAPQTLKATGNQAAAKRKKTDTDGEVEKEGENRKRNKCIGETQEVKDTRPVNGGVAKKRKAAIEGERKSLGVEKKKSNTNSSSGQKNEHGVAASSDKHLVGKKSAKSGRKAAVRPVKNKREKNRKSESGSRTSNDPQSQEESESDAEQQRHRKVLSSEEEVDEDTSWNPSKKKAKVNSLGRTRKSLSEKPKSRKSSSGSSDNITEQRKRTRGYRATTDLEVVLDDFLDFCDQYRDSVESKAVKQSIDCFSNNVKEQLSEKISSYKELRLLKRENAKVGSLIQKKTQKLVDAKHELMRAERQVWLMQKEKAELNLRLNDLKRGCAFLRDIGELNKQYLDYRKKHPKEKEIYGASSLPALILETKYRQTEGHCN